MSASQRVGSTSSDAVRACSARTQAGRQRAGRQAGRQRGGVKKTNDKHICTLLQVERVLASFLFHYSCPSLSLPPYHRSQIPPFLLPTRNRRSWQRHIDNCRSILYTLLTWQINTHVNMYGSVRVFVCACVWGCGRGRRSCVPETKDNVAWH